MMLRMAIAACLLAAGPAGAQRLTRGLGYSDGGWPRVTVSSTGSLLLSAGGADVVPGEPGAYLFLRRVMEDGRSEQLEIVGVRGGGTRREHRVNGTVVGDPGEAFFHEVIPGARLGSLAEHTRLVRLRHEGGVAAVLRHVAALSDLETKVGGYLELLVDPTLSAAEMSGAVDGVLAVTGGQAWSSRMLRALASVAGDLRPEAQAVVVRTLMRAPADTALSHLIQDLPHMVSLDDPAVAAAFFGGAAAHSAIDRPILPRLVAGDRSLPASVTATAIRAGAPLSEADRVELLLAVPQVCLRSSVVRAAYAELMGTVRYEMDRLRVQGYLEQAAVPAWQGLAPPCGR